jgi:type I restriction enzyme R subunit
VTPRGFTEDELVERPAVTLLEGLEWEHKNCYDDMQRGTCNLGRETFADVVLVSRLRPRLEALNPKVPAVGLDEAVRELMRDRTRMSPANANREVAKLLKDGVRVTAPGEDGDEAHLVRVVDWDDPSRNDYLACSQFWIAGEMHKRRPDLIGFINGIPLVFIELKASHVRLENSYRGNLKDYKDTIPQVFTYNGFIILSNGSETKVGSMTAGWEHFADWKKVDDEAEAGRVSLETVLRGMLDRQRVLDIIENFTLFQDQRGGTVKVVAKNHQFLGVNNAIRALQAKRAGDGEDGRLGVFWHTQGSGKSLSMAFFAQKVLRKLPGNWTFVVVTDRVELDDQIYTTFQQSGVVNEGHVQAESSTHLRQLLAEDHRYVFTLIHKFRTELGKAHPVLSGRDDIIVITDEAHRSQYDALALNMRSALPHAGFLAFTGTPLISGEEQRTKQVFGGYVSTYTFRQSIEDQATIPLYYENRIPEVQIVNPDMDDDLWAAIEAADLDEAAEKKLERELGNNYHLITREDRLDKVAQDIVEHFPVRGFRGKGMVICIDKATAVRMYDKVKAHWNRKIRELATQVQAATSQEKDALTLRLNWMKETDMAVVVSQSQGEVDDMRERGLDIGPHRRRFVEEDLESKFKNPDDPFRLVFLCSMWMTGFDVPSCSTIYLDKPMRHHTLMQTIARANRVYPGKTSGNIVDYVGVFSNLEKALAIYGGGHGGADKPVETKEALVQQLREALEAAREYCTDIGIDMAAIEAAEGFDKIRRLDSARDAAVRDDGTKAEFLSYARYTTRLFKAVLPDARASEFAMGASTLAVIAEKIRNLDPPGDIGDVMADIEEVLDRSISAEGYVIDVPTGPEQTGHLVDISRIDFEALQRVFGAHKASANQAAKAGIQRRVLQMVERNRTRVDFLERFQEMVDAYNSGSVNQEEFFRQLRAFAADLDVEEERHIRDGLSEEELAVFDLLTKPNLDLTDKEADQVKKAAKELLAKLKGEKLRLDWRKHQQARADVKVTIQDVLDQTLPAGPYGRQVFADKCAAVFQHVFDAYPGHGEGVYAEP